MKPIAVVAILICCQGCAGHFMEGWSRQDTIRQVAFTAVLAADLGVQTPKYLENGTELNPIISKGNLPVYGLACAIGHFIISGYLKPEVRKGWQLGWIAAEGVTVARNTRY